jgi:RNA-directed DNA polymerase
VEQFERKLKDNLYKIWNRMSSGTYFPPPVRTVAIPKKGGGERMLGIPTVADRIAQTVVAMYLERLVEPHFLRRVNYFCRSRRLFLPVAAKVN